MRQSYYLAALLSIFIAGLWIQCHIFLNWDTSWLMELANRIHTSGIDKNNFLEINTPMSIYIYYPAVLIMKWCGLAKITALRIYVFTLSATSLLFCATLLNLLFPSDNHRIARWSMICLTATYILLPAVHFSQREHIYMLLIFPYLLTAALRIENTLISIKITIPAGMLAAIGFAIKPHFLLLAVFVELFILYKTKKWSVLFRTESIIIFTFLYLYLLSVIYLQPGYITTVIPLTQKYYYLGYQMSFSTFLTDILLLYCLGVSCLYLFLGKHSGTPLHSILCIAIIASMFSYLFQGIPSAYRLYPALSISLLLSMLLFLERLTSKNMIINLVMVAFLFTLPIAATAQFTYSSFESKKYSYLNAIIHYVQAHSLHGKTLFISTSPPSLIADYLPQNSLFILQPYLPFWVLSGLVTEQITSQLGQTNISIQNKKPILEFSQSIAAIIHDAKPDIIFVDNRIMIKQSQLTFDYLHFFLQNPNFKREWLAYQLIGRVKYFEVYKHI